MFLHMKNEPSFVSCDEQWYGERFYFEKKNLIHQEFLEVIYYSSFSTFSYRYVSMKGFSISIEQGIELTLSNAKLPFWVKKIFHQFSQGFH